jgi:hypothetical protein
MQIILTADWLATVTVHCRFAGREILLCKWADAYYGLQSRRSGWVQIQLISRYKLTISSSYKSSNHSFRQNIHTNYRWREDVLTRDAQRPIASEKRGFAALLGADILRSWYPSLSASHWQNHLTKITVLWYQSIVSALWKFAPYST